MPHIGNFFQQAFDWDKDPQGHTIGLVDPQM